MVAAAQNRMPRDFSVNPKTHTPLRHMQELGLRYYSPELGRWVSRDPISEQGAQLLLSSGRITTAFWFSSGLRNENMYGFVGNAATIHYDPVGLVWPELVLDTIVRCAAGSLIQWLGETIVETLTTYAVCNLWISGDCVENGAPVPRRRMEADFNVGSLPSNITSDFFDCLATAGIAAPDFQITAGHEILFRCIDHGIRFSIWSVVTISDDEGNSTTQRNTVFADDCGESTWCVCDCPR